MVVRQANLHFGRKGRPRAFWYLWLRISRSRSRAQDVVSTPQWPMTRLARHSAYGASTSSHLLRAALNSGARQSWLHLCWTRVSTFNAQTHTYPEYRNICIFLIRHFLPFFFSFASGTLTPYPPNPFSLQLCTSFKDFHSKLTSITILVWPLA